MLLNHNTIYCIYIYTIKHTTKHNANVNYNNILMEGGCQEKISKNWPYKTRPVYNSYYLFFPGFNQFLIVL